jgi:hypothetical protein
VIWSAIIDSKDGNAMKDLTKMVPIKNEYEKDE